MAFITVSFPGRQRDVYIDGEVTGLTSETLSVEKDTHTIYLGKPPFLIVNASDMSLGTRFEFTQDEFDVICSDLSSYPIARAVAASSEFLGLLSPLTIHNYAASASGCGWTEPDWVGNAIDDRDVLSTRFRDATNVRSYRDGKSRPYLHLLHGGVSDKLGLRGPIRSTASTDPAFSLRRMIDLHRVHRLAVIVVNAKTEAASRWDTREKAPGVLSVLKTAANTPMGDYSFETVELFQRLVDEWNQASAGRKACEGILRDHCPEARLAGGSLTEVAYYPIVVGFDAIADPASRSFFKTLPTTFELPSGTADGLRAVGRRLLRESTEYQRLLTDLSGAER